MTGACEHAPERHRSIDATLISEDEQLRERNPVDARMGLATKVAELMAKRPNILSPTGTDTAFATAGIKTATKSIRSIASSRGSLSPATAWTPMSRDGLRVRLRRLTPSPS